MNISEILPQINLDFYKNVSVENPELDGLGERQKMVYENLQTFKSEGATAKELSVLLHKEGKVMSNERNTVHPRLNELIHLGLVEVIGKKTCQFTDRKVTIYKCK